MTAPVTGLIADIGGTNARFALVDALGALVAVDRVATADFPDPVAAARSVIARHAPETAPQHAAWAVACPVLDDRITLTNHAWSFSRDQARIDLGLETLAVVNDFAANALAIPDLTENDCAVVGPDRTGRADAPVAALGPGTGLGVALLLPRADGGWRPLATEGGHVTLAAATEDEAQVIAAVRRTYPHVSAERLISGPGLLLLYRTLRALDGGNDATPLETPKAITQAAASGSDPIARRAVAMMFAMLGTVAGNLVLSTGALGGVYLLGGIVPATVSLFRDSAFRSRFEDKGRFRDYLAAVPTRVVLHPNPAFPGLLRLLRQGEG